MSTCVFLTTSQCAVLRVTFSMRGREDTAAVAPPTHPVLYLWQLERNGGCNATKETFRQRDCGANMASSLETEKPQTYFHRFVVCTVNTDHRTRNLS